MNNVHKTNQKQSTSNYCDSNCLSSFREIKIETIIFILLCGRLLCIVLAIKSCDIFNVKTESQQCI